MTRAARLLLVAVCALAASACDSEDPEVRAPDAELILGTWTGSSVNARVITPLGDVSLPIPGVDASAFGASFQGTGVQFAFDPDDDAVLSIPQTEFSIPLPDEASFGGTYSLDEAAEQLVLSRDEIDGGELRLGYELRSASDLELIAEDAEAFAELFGLIGGDAEALAGVVSGGSIRYRK